jgi:hypothetical protein
MHQRQRGADLRIDQSTQPSARTIFDVDISPYRLNQQNADQMIDYDRRSELPCSVLTGEHMEHRTEHRCNV